MFINTLDNYNLLKMNTYFEVEIKEVQFI